MFDDWAPNFLDLTLGSYDTDLTLTLLGEQTHVWPRFAGLGRADFDAKLDVVSRHSLYRVGDLTRLLAIDTVLVPTGKTRSTRARRPICCEPTANS